MTEFFNVGKIVNTHGIKGEVKVIRITDFEERFKPGNQLYLFLKDHSDPIKLTIKNHRKHKQFDMLIFEDYPSINDVEIFKQGILKVHQDDRQPLEEEGSYYYHEIIGCEVQTTSGETLGRIGEILSPGANDVWVVKRRNNKDILIPYIEQIVKTVDVKERIVTIEPMEGLLS